MGRHRQHNDLERSVFRTDATFFPGPEGASFGHGTTVGNGVEGWAPNAIFVHTDGGARARTYRNQGTITSASWVEECHIVDNDYLSFGTDSDWHLRWCASDAGMYEGPPTGGGMWANVPMHSLGQRHLYVAYHDDFFPGATSPSADQTTVCTYDSTDDGGTGTNAFSVTSVDHWRGVFNVVTAAAADDYHLMSSPFKNFMLRSDQGWFEAMIKLTEAATDDANWVVGFSDTLTNGFLQASGGGPPADWKGAVFFKTENGTNVQFEHAASTTHQTQNVATWPSGDWTRVGWHQTSGQITPYVNGTAGTAVTFPSTDEFYLIFGVKAGSTNAAETLQVDYVTAVSNR